MQLQLWEELAVVLKFPLVVHTTKKVVVVGARDKHGRIHNKVASSYIPGA
jgi:hypothetical protein